MGGLTIPLIFVLVGLFLIVMAIVGKIAGQTFEIGPLNTTGRIACGLLGCSLLAGGSWFGLLQPSKADVGAAPAVQSPAPTPSAETSPATATAAALPTDAGAAPSSLSATSQAPALGRLELQIPTIDGAVPKSKVDIRVRGVTKDSFESVWVAVHNKNDPKNNWNFYACNSDTSDAEYKCPEVQVGRTDFPAGQWTIVAVVVDAKGNSVITNNRPALVAPDLKERFGRSLKAYGAADAWR